MSNTDTPQHVIEKILYQYQNELSTEIDKSSTLLSLRRIYDSGKVLELALKKFLLRLLPDYVGITRGFVFSSDCKNHSQEIDLILYDKRYFNGFLIDELGTETVSYVSIDTVFGIISVKKTLDLTSLKNSINNINSVYELDRKPLTNQFHYDLDFKPHLEYKNGLEINRIFSCIFSYKNNLLYKTKNKKSVLRSEDELISYFDSLHKKECFKNIKFDLICTLDGTIFFPFEYIPENDIWRLTAKIQYLGCIKKAAIIESYNGKFKSNTDDIILGYKILLKEPHLPLGQFITFLQFYCSQLVKTTPDILKIFQNTFKGKSFCIQNQRSLKKS